MNLLTETLDYMKELGKTPDDVFSEFTENEKEFIRELVNKNVEKGCCGGCL